MTENDKKRYLEAEAFIRLSLSNDGRAFLGEIGKDFDKAMQALLYAKVEDLATAQGAARALHETLKKITDAHTRVEKQGNTHGAS